MGELGPFGGACVCGELGAFECGVCGAWVGVSLVPSVTGYPRWVVSWMPSVASGEWGAWGDGECVSLMVCGCVRYGGSGVPSGVPWGCGLSLGPWGWCLCVW